MTASADSERNGTMTSTNTVVANAMAARTARNGVEVEISPGYAARVQHAMRDAARVVSGVRMTSTNTLECRDEDAADDVIDILKQAGLPAGEVWTNAKRVARNADRYKEKSFGNGDVKASLKDFGRDPIYEINVYTTGITSAVSFADKGKKCVAEARAVLSAVERKASALKQAISWMEQNAKAW